MTKFLYFAYGSNLLSQRIHINNKSAIRIGTGKLNVRYIFCRTVNFKYLNEKYFFLKGFRLDFNGPSSNFWMGCPATVVADDGQYVWGAIWQFNISDLVHLDEQEGVKEKVYLPFEANIETPGGGNVQCRSYMLSDQPIKEEPLPLNRRPSKAYLETILLGARESGLPLDYLKFLNTIPHNDNAGPVMPWSNT